MRRTAVFLIATVLLISLIGCIDLEEQVVLNADGTGTVFMKYSIMREGIDQLAQMGESIATMAGEEAPEIDDGKPSREEVEQHLAEYNTSVKLLSFKESETDDQYIYEMKFSFEDINDIWICSGALSLEDETDDGESISKIYTKQSDGNWFYNRPLNEDDEGDDQDYQDDEDYSSEYSEYDEDSEEEGTSELEFGEGSMSDIESAMAGFASAAKNAAGQMEKEMARHKFILSITFPGKIKETNATSTKGKTATWEYNLVELESAPRMMTATIEP